MNKEMEVSDKSLQFYFPYRFSLEQKFLNHYKDSSSLQDYLLGKREHYIDGKGNYGNIRKLHGVTDRERLRREYIWGEFEAWQRWVAGGRVIYSFTKELLNILKVRNVANLSLDALKIPCPEFYISLKKLNIPFAEGYPYYIDGVYISYELNPATDLSYEFAISFYFAGDYEFFHLKYGDFINEFYHYNFKTFTLILDKKENIFNVAQAINDHLKWFAADNVIEDKSMAEEILQLHAAFLHRTIMVSINALYYLSLQDIEIHTEYPLEVPAYLKERIAKADSAIEKEYAEYQVESLGYGKIHFVGK